MSEVLWSEPALDHLEAIRVYIEKFNPVAARDVALTLKALGDSLSEFPYRGRLVRGKKVREIINTYPYIIRYQIDGGKVERLRVRDSSRRPTKR